MASVESEPIAGVWVGAPSGNIGEEPLVRGEAPLKLKNLDA